MASGNGVDAAVAVVQADRAVDGADVLRAVADEVVDGVAAGERHDGVSELYPSLAKLCLTLQGDWTRQPSSWKSVPAANQFHGPLAAAVLAFDRATAKAAAVGADVEAAVGEAVFWSARRSRRQGY